tara:strand:- start:21218 stop:21685 length:468 start_codon:yes stop_codon:yes gene_type:complete
MLTLESFKLLNAKANRFEASTGGTPDITFHEVSDVLAQMSQPAAAYARLRYANQERYARPVLYHIRREVLRETGDPILKDYWQYMTRLALHLMVAENGLTNRMKAEAIHVRWWTKNNERDLQQCLYIVDQLDFEIRSELKAWNERLSIGEIEPIR